MMRSIFLVLVFTLSLLSCNTAPVKRQQQVEVARQMGEFEKIDALWLIWPATDHKKGESVKEVSMRIIDELRSDLKIVISCADEEALVEAKAVLGKKYTNLDNLSFQLIPSVELWARDMGPVFVETEDGKHAIADFNFNSWGYSDTLDLSSKIEEKFDERVAELLDLPIVSSTMISEGGNRELNGKGTLLVTEVVEMGRNPEMTKVQMEKEYERLLGVKKVIWLKNGLQEDQHTFLGPLTTVDSTKAYTVVTTNGHVDEFARFVNDSTVLLASIDTTELEDPIARENHLRMEENFAILSKSNDQDGNPLNIVRLPLPQTILTTMSPGDYVYDYIKTLEYRDGSHFPDGDTITVVAPASYLNFIITNKVVLGQKYWREGMPDKIKMQDNEAKRILEEVFPNRKVVMLDALAVNLGGGGLHCISMHQPVLNTN
ncbi:agmatine deiminase family protein [Poritiphilus flavus]|uniref:Agmatine deiminase family protein n=1 Tax=Poritiphilus flavus TaxID=2697053 RepID=A0A6L9EGR9_9FLAO|nr:agmatine deiminase family protein [Poritiphilus flavus]NAS13881.1 agmatine deiminase family protein [Poritiphilus flavus]